MPYTSQEDISFRRYGESRLLGLRINRYSYWVHWRELADYELPRRYKWLITPNQMSRGSPINQHILDETGTLASRNLAAGILSGLSNPTRPWFKLKVGKIDSAGNNPASVWLKIVEQMMMLVFHFSNFYQALATFYYDLVVFGTAVMLIYEDYDSVIRCYNPCLGEYYIDNDGKLRPRVFYREFTYTVSQTVNEYGFDNCSDQVKKLYEEGTNKVANAANLSKEIIIAHGVEPNEGKDSFGISRSFPFRELHWEWGGSTNPQSSGAQSGLLRKRGFHENPATTVRWDLLGNEAYGRSPGMDALPGIKQLQQETRRKAQGIDKGINPPMNADIQLKNAPASLLPGGVTYSSGLIANGHPGMVPIYGNWKPDIQHITEDIALIQDRIKKTFFNDLFQTISQYETRSNITAVEIDARRAEALIMLGPVLGRLTGEGLNNFIDRTFGIMARAGILPPAPQEIAGKDLDIEFVSILAQAQQAAAAGSIERLLGIAGNLAGLDPAVIDKIDIDYTLDKYSELLNNDPRLMRTAEAVAAIRQQRAEQQQQQQAAEQVPNLLKGAELASQIDVGGGRNAIQQAIGV